MIHQCSPSELLAGAALAHHADPSGVSQPHRVGMMLEYSSGDLIARAAFMHHDDQGHDVLRHHAVLKGLNLMMKYAALTPITLGLAGGAGSRRPASVSTVGTRGVACSRLPGTEGAGQADTTLVVLTCRTVA